MTLHHRNHLFIYKYYTVGCQLMTHNPGNLWANFYLIFQSRKWPISWLPTSQIRRFHHQKMNRKTLLLIGNKTDQDYKSDTGIIWDRLSRNYLLYSWSIYDVKEMIKNFSKKFTFWEEISCRDDQKQTFKKVYLLWSIFGPTFGWKTSKSDP